MNGINYFLIFFPLLIAILPFFRAINDWQVWIVSLSSIFMLLAAHVIVGIVSAQDAPLVIPHSWYSFSFDQTGVFSDYNYHSDKMTVMLSFLAILVAGLCLWHDRASFIKARGSISVLGAALTAVLGACFSVNIGSFSAFYIVFFIVRLVSIGMEEGEVGITSRESTLNSLLGILLLWFAILLMNKTGLESVSHWLSTNGLGGESGIKLVSFGFVLLSVLLIGGIFPFHSTIRSIFFSPKPWQPFFSTAQVIFSLVLLFRVTPFSFFQEMSVMAAPLQILFGIFFLVTSIILLLAKQFRDRIFWQFQFLLISILVGFVTMSARGWEGAVCLFIQLLVSTPLLLLIARETERRADFAGIAGFSQNPRLGFCLMLAVIGASLFPLSMGFWGIILIVWSASLCGVILISLLLVALLIYLLSYRTFLFPSEKPPVAVKSVSQDLVWNEIVTFAPLLGILFGCGLLPFLVWGMISYSVTGAFAILR